MASSCGPIQNSLPRPANFLAIEPDAIEHTPSPQEQSPVRNKEHRPNVVYDPELHEAREKAKELEWRLTLNALCAVNTVEEMPAPDRSQALSSRLRRIEKLLEIVPTVLDKPFSSPRLTQDEIQYILKQHSSQQRLVDELAAELYSELSCSFEEAYDDLIEQVISLSNFINESTEYANCLLDCRIKVILIKLRQALQNPAYGLLRAEERDPCVRFLHALAMTSYIKTETAEAYITFGDAVLKKAHVKRIHSMGDMFTSMRNAAADAGIPEDDPLVSDWYIAKIAELHLPEAFAVNLSRVLDVAHVVFKCIRAGVSTSDTWQMMRNHIDAFFINEYKDHKGIHGNLSTVSYEERFKSDNSTLNIRVIMGATPATGPYVQPEFSALLQAAENRQVAEMPDVLYPNTTAIFFTNLQKLNGSPEGIQSKTIMNLNERYLSFGGITLSTDKPSGNQQFDATIKEKKIAEILAEDQKKYYFPPALRDKLQQHLPAIVDKVYTMMYDRNTDKKIELFNDIVHLAVIRYFEADAAANATRDTGEDNQLLSFRLCRAGTDRAVEVNSKFRWTLDPTARVASVSGISRAVLGKGRLPLEHIVTQTGLYGHDLELNQEIKTLFYWIDSLASNDALHSEGLSYPGYPEEYSTPPKNPSKKKLFQYESDSSSSSSADLSAATEDND